MSPTPSMSYSVVEAVATITFGRPEVLNAFRRQDFAELAELLTRAADDTDVRVIVVTGTGRAFSAGEDLGELTAVMPDLSGASLRAQVEELQDLTRLILGIEKPVIAALNGLAVGVGAEIAVACDLRVAATSAQVAFPEVTRGLFETNGVTWLLPRMIGRGRAMRLMMEGEFIDAATCLAWGLVEEVIADDSLADHAQELAARIAQRAPASVAWVKRAVASALESDLETALGVEVEGLMACLATEDLREGLAAFHNGRSPRYQGR